MPITLQHLGLQPPIHLMKPIFVAWVVLAVVALRLPSHSWKERILFSWASLLRFQTTIHFQMTVPLRLYLPFRNLNKLSRLAYPLNLFVIFIIYCS